ncbi:MAG: HNH endonuclease [Candidatus Omnitrophica bacterium]|nr:HNH endonuclease [Candidatus Omnitrophota bacterium]
MDFSFLLEQLVWAKGRLALGFDPNYVRMDAYGTLIERKQYGNRDSLYGWEIDHIVPQSLGGSDSLTNLRPLNWHNNVRRQAGLLA